MLSTSRAYVSLKISKVCIFRVSRYKYSSIWNACNHRVFISFLNWIIYYVGLFVRDGLRCKEEIIIHRLNIGHPRLTYIHHQLICFRLSHERWIFRCYGLLLHFNMIIMIQYPSYYSTIMQVCWITNIIWSLFIMLVMTPGYCCSSRYLLNVFTYNLKGKLVKFTLFNGVLEMKKKLKQVHWKLHKWITHLLNWISKLRYWKYLEILVYDYW